MACLEVRADDLRGRTVDKVPVVDRAGVSEIELMDRLARGRIGTVVLPDQDEQRQQPLFVPGRLQQRDDILQWHVAVFPCDRAQLRNRDAEETIARAILAGSGFEKPLVALSPLTACNLPEIAPYGR